MQSEPVITATTVGAIVGALLALLAAFGLGIDDEQIKAILAFVGVVAPVVISAIYARSRVTPVQQAHDPNLRR